MQAHTLALVLVLVRQAKCSCLRQAINWLAALRALYTASANAWHTGERTGHKAPRAPWLCQSF